MAKPRYEELEDQQRRYVGQACEGEDKPGVAGPDVLHNCSKDGAAERSRGTADADDSGDSCRGEHVGGGREEVGRPALVRCCGEREQGDGWPVIAWEPCTGYRHEDDGKYKAGAGKHRAFTS